MEWTSGELVKVIFTLLPGFLTAWVFHALTAHRIKREAIERVIQALIFTALVRAMLPGVEWLWGKALHYLPLRPWDLEISNGASLVVAVLMGIVFALFANRDWFHFVMRSIGVTKRTSHPSEWYSVFASDRRYVILHLKDGRRLSGWPFQWPDHPDTGHFLMCNAEWLDEASNQTLLPTIEFVVIPVEMVEIVDIEKRPEEIGVERPVCKVESVPAPIGEIDGQQIAQAAVEPKRITTRVDGEANGSSLPPATAARVATATKKMNSRQKGKGKR